MKDYRFIKLLRSLSKRLWPLTPWSVFWVALVVALCAEGSAFVVRYTHTDTIATTGANTITAPSPLVQPKVLHTGATTTSPAATSAPQTKTTNATTDCSAVIAKYEQEYASALSDDWNTWANDTLLFTPAEINYEYNQYAQNDYNLYSQLIQVNGCTSHLSLALKYPATNPDNDTKTPPITHPICNTVLQDEYETSYNSQYQALMEQESSEIQSVRAQIVAAGGGNSSAWDEVPSEVAQQFSSKFAALKTTLSSQLASVDCLDN